MRAMRVSNPRVREIQTEMENDDVIRLVAFGLKLTHVECQIGPDIQSNLLKYTVTFMLLQLTLYGRATFG